MDDQFGAPFAGVFNTDGSKCPSGVWSWSPVDDRREGSGIVNATDCSGVLAGKETNACSPSDSMDTSAGAGVEDLDGGRGETGRGVSLGVGGRVASFGVDGR